MPKASVSKAPPTKKTSREVVTKAQAIAEFGEEVGPILYKKIKAANNEKQPATPVTRLRDRIDEWCMKEQVTVQFKGFAPGLPGVGEIERSVEQLTKDLDQDCWTVLVFRPGNRRPITFPSVSEFPPNETLPEIIQLAGRFNPRRYWGDDFDITDFEGNVGCGSHPDHVAEFSSRRLAG